MTARATNSEENWISTSDLMAGLMVIFLFIAIAYIKSIGQEESHATKDICDDLVSTFADVEWRDEIEVCIEPLVVRFINPEALFEKGSAVLTRRYETILNEFMPLYMQVVKKHENKISKVRIEGHTDDSWQNESNRIVRFYNNMQLSQTRTYSVLRYALQMPEVIEDPDWVIANLESAGRSSSNPIYDLVAREVDPERSRRVDFRINLNILEKRLKQLGASVDSKIEEELLEDELGES